MNDTLTTLIETYGLAAIGYALGFGYERVSGPIEYAAAVIALLVVTALVIWFLHGRALSACRRNDS